MSKQIRAGYDSTTAKSQISSLYSSLLASTDDQDVDVVKALQKAARSSTGITAAKVKQLSADCEYLADMFQLDGINAQFLANVLQNQLASGNGLDLITEKAILMNELLNDSADAFSRVDAAIAQYNSQTASGEYDDDFKTFSGYYDSVVDQYKANRKYNAYLQKAESIGLSSEWKALIQNGAIDFSTIEDEDLYDQIQDYQDWYDDFFEEAKSVIKPRHRAMLRKLLTAKIPRAPRYNLPENRLRMIEQEVQRRASVLLDHSS